MQKLNIVKLWLCVYNYKLVICLVIIKALLLNVYLQFVLSAYFEVINIFNLINLIIH